ncbi:MAG: hypothetical protein ACD_45C00340G0001 [uncultured bacterium]|nr:MAG: hypothetical protein ACD_45C00340G0001 [uncultured bacterium]OGT47167.1 MAG: hypothetical protein A3E83_05265 [Gammaproteobacteria bacterium RIFCSPHIGHO2_12_FULL_41_20]
MVGFRSDYYALAKLFQSLVPEYALLAKTVISSEGSDRNFAFFELCDKVENLIVTPLFQRPQLLQASASSLS